MAYTSVNKSSNYIKNLTYAGNGSTNAITGVGFQPDFVWVKDREATKNHNLFNAASGTGKYLECDAGTEEQTATNVLTSFDSDGFTLGDHNECNNNGDGFISWNWKGGTTSGITTNGSTDITPSSYSFSQTGGFSVIRYTGNGSTPTKIAHGLGAVPHFMIVKRASAPDNNWVVYNQGVGNTKYLKLDTTDNEITAGGAAWENTTPDSVNFTIGDHGQTNASGEPYVAWLFTEKSGYSKFNTYLGNGNADGTFVFTGFAPSWVLIKMCDGSADGWWIIDNTIGNMLPNPNTRMLVANTSAADNSSVSPFIDFLSNGFKIKSTWAGVNQNTSKYAYFAFGQSLVGDNNVPCTGR